MSSECYADVVFKDTMKQRKKLIEVALPLDAINKASAREKSIRHGHPSTLHLWWARRPLAAARAVIFAQMVDDPSSHPERFPTEEAQKTERDRLFRLIEELVKWESTTNEKVLDPAREEIRRSWRQTCADNKDHPRAAELFDPDKLPAFHDPFAGGGALPLEAQRLGLEAHASDLNPVAVLINKAMIEIPPKFAGMAPVNPRSREDRNNYARKWEGAQGLAEDVRYYGEWMRDEAKKRIGHLYPKVEITEEMAKERPDLKQYIGRELTVIAWLWARTVKSPNPAFRDVDVPLVSAFMLSTKQGKEAYVEPVIEEGGYRFTVKVGKPKDEEAAKAGTKYGRGSNFRCVMSGEPIAGDYIKAEGKAGRMGARLLAIVAEGDRGRVYLTPTAKHEAVAAAANPEWRPSGDVPARLTGGTCVPYGLTQWGDLFTPRQLVALTIFSDLVGEAMERVRADAITAGLLHEPVATSNGDRSTAAYAQAVQSYLTFGVSKAADRNTSLCVWEQRMDRMRGTFGRQALPMVWDYVETNPLAGAGGDIYGTVHSLCEVLDKLPARGAGESAQISAQNQQRSDGKLVSTDPPYYDNIGYADLSDFFYVWLRRSLQPVYPDLFATLAVPKADELVATPYRHGSKQKAEDFFLNGMTKAMGRLAEQAHPSSPVTIYYAFKQSEKAGANGGTASTGWETFLDATIRAGFSITGTWPMRTELGSRMIGSGSNALASSIVLVCQKRSADAATATRRELLSALKRELPDALRLLQAGNIAPVDLAQAAIGPGMGIYTRYAKVIDADGKPVTVREALALINEVLDEVLAEQEGDFDSDTRWAIAWFDDVGFTEGQYGTAETLSKAKNTSVSGLVEAGFLASKSGKVRLLKPAELSASWDPEKDARLTVWEMVHYLIRVLESDGEEAAAGIVKSLGSKAETARELAYRLYTVCERKKWAKEALSYNGLVQSWPEISRLAQEMDAPTEATQTALFG